MFTTLSTLWRARRGRKALKPARPWRFRPQLELLEDRLCLSSYEITNLHDLLEPYGVIGSSATAVNNLGDVVVNSRTPGTDAERLFLVEGNGVVTDLTPLIGGYYFEVLAINDSRQIAGTRFSEDFQLIQGFIYQHGQTPALIELGLDRYPRDINDAGEVVGFDDSSNRGFLYRNGNSALLGDVSSLYGINNLGHVVGGFGNGPDLYRNGEFIDIGPPPGPPTAFFVTPYDINDSGQIAGVYQDFPGGGFNFAVPFIWKEGIWTTIAFPESNPSWRAIIVESINESGVAVANAHSKQIPPFGTQSPWVFSISGAKNINSLNPSSSPFSEIFSVADINNRGDIVGIGRLPPNSGPGIFGAFLLTPVPVPDLGDFGVSVDAEALRRDPSNVYDIDYDREGTPNQGLGLTFDARNAAAGPVQSASEAGLLDNADHTGKEWRLFAGAQSSGGVTDAGLRGAADLATASAEFYDTVTVSGGILGPAVGTPVPIYLTVRVTGTNTNPGYTSYRVGTNVIRVADDGSKTFYSIPPQESHFAPQQMSLLPPPQGSPAFFADDQTAGPVHYEHVLYLGMADIGERLIVEPFLSAAAGTGGAFTASPESRSEIRAIFNLASSVPGVELAGASGWSNFVDANHNGRIDSPNAPYSQLGIREYNSDLDRDGLLDPWEEFGYDANNDGTIDDSTYDVLLPKMGASFMRKDVFVEADYMTDDTHSHKPDDDAMKNVINVFDAAPVDNPIHADNSPGSTGINLHVDSGPDSLMNRNTAETWQQLSRSNSVPEISPLSTLAFLFRWGAFDDIKADSFQAQRAPIFHYAVFAHKISGAGGISRGIPASDFMIATGDNPVVNHQASGLMHELGHNLGLYHGGDEGFPNYKPNYLSVMNYIYVYSGLTVNGTSGLLDYSRFDSTDIPDLVEYHLDERESAVGHHPYGVTYYCGNQLHSEPNASSGVDWNCNGIFEASITDIDINDDFWLGSLHSFNDWKHLVFNGGTVGQDAALALPVQTHIQTHTPDEDALLLGLIKITPVSEPNTTESGGTATFTVGLGQQATSGVTIYLTSGNPAEGTTSATSLTFTPDNWDIPQTVIVTGVDDAVIDGDQVYAIVTSAAISDDLTFSGLDPVDVWLVNRDNETLVEPPAVLTVSKSGAGTGTVASSPAGIDCGADCSESYDAGTQVTLTAKPDANSTFAGWSDPNCPGAGMCVVTMDAAKGVTATFTLQTFALTVGKSGDGTGAVASSPAGIDCGADCSESYDAGTPVMLTATPEANSTFAGWSDPNCPGTGTCVVTMDAAKGVTATFTSITVVAPPHVESVVINGGHRQRSKVNRLTVTFDGTVMLDPGAFELVRRYKGLQSTITGLNVASNEVNGKTVAVLTFSGLGIIGGSLPDGDYTLTVRGDQVHDALGELLDGDSDGFVGGEFDYEFHRLFGDSDGDHDVDRADLRDFVDALVRNRRHRGYTWYYDYNQNDRINGVDSREFHRRFGKRR